MKMLYKKKVYFLVIALFLLNSCVANNTGPETMSKYYVQKGESKLSVKKNFFYTSSPEDPFYVEARINTGKRHYYDSRLKVEILYPFNETVFLVFTDVNFPVNCQYWPCQYGDGFYDSTHYSLVSAIEYVEEKYKKTNNVENKVKKITKIKKKNVPNKSLIKEKTNKKPDTGIKKLLKKLY